MKNEINKSENGNEPVTGVYLFGRNIKNDGKIISEGKRPVTYIQTDKYSGKGIVNSKQLGLQSEKWYQKWWIQYLIFPLSVGIVLIFIGLYVKGK